MGGDARSGRAAVRLDSVVKVYGDAGRGVRALDDVSVTLMSGTFTAVMGPSGSGKSTFLQCASGLDRPTSGSVAIGGVGLAGLGEKNLTEFRRAHIGFVFQAYNLVPSLTVRQNVGLPLRFAGHRPDKRQIGEVLERLAIGDLARRLPHELSGGQQQRVAIARSLVTRPDVIFADEPTGALDTMTARQILTLLRDCALQGQTIVMVTHDPVAAAYGDRVLYLADGRIVEEMTEPTADRVAERMTRLGAWAT